MTHKIAPLRKRQLVLPSMPRPVERERFAKRDWTAAEFKRALERNSFRPGPGLYFTDTSWRRVAPFMGVYLSDPIRIDRRATLAKIIRERELVEDMTLVDAVALFKRTLPGWWFTLGDCQLTAHASCGPDRHGPDERLLEMKSFDEGFHADLLQPSTPAKALLEVMAQARAAKAEACAHEQRSEAA